MYLTVLLGLYAALTTAAADNGRGSVSSDPAAAISWIRVGRSQLLERHFHQAQKSAERATEAEPGSARAYILLGEADRELHDFDGAYRAWLRAAELDTFDTQSRYYLGRLFYEASHFQQAAAWFRETLKIHSGHFQAMTYLGLCAENMNLQTTAEQLYRSALAESRAQRKPYSWAWLSLAKLLRQRGNEAEALALLNEGEKLCPEPHLLTQLGQLLYSAGELERSEAVLRRAVQQDPEIAASHYTLARIYRQQGRTHEAREETEAFLRAKQSVAEPSVIAIQTDDK